MWVCVCLCLLLIRWNLKWFGSLVSWSLHSFCLHFYFLFVCFFMNVKFAKSSHMSSCQSHFVLSTRRVFVSSLVARIIRFKVRSTQQQQQQNTIQHKQKKITFCFIGSEAEAYDVISDAEGTLLFLHWVECLNVITCRWVTIKMQSYAYLEGSCTNISLIFACLFNT